MVSPLALPPHPPCRPPAEAASAASKEAAAHKAAALAAAAERARGGGTDIEPADLTEAASSSSASEIGTVEQHLSGDDDGTLPDKPSWCDEEGLAAAMRTQQQEGGGVSVEGIQGLHVGEWANCELLQPILAAVQMVG